MANAHRHTQAFHTSAERPDGDHRIAIFGTVEGPWSYKTRSGASGRYVPFLVCKFTETGSKTSLGAMSSESRYWFLELDHHSANNLEGPTEYKLHLLLRPRRNCKIYIVYFLLLLLTGYTATPMFSDYALSRPCADYS